MKFKKLLSAAMAGLMLVTSAVAVSAADGKVYTAEDFCKPVTCIPYSTNVSRYYQGYFGNYYGQNVWYVDKDGTYCLDANWNPYTGIYGNSTVYYNYCTCNICKGVSSYYWVNGIPYCSSTGIAYKPVVVPAATEVEPQKVEYSKNDGIVKKSTIPGYVKKSTTVLDDDEGYYPHVATKPSANKGYSVVYPGSIYNCITIPGTYYAYDKVDINKYFESNTFHMVMDIGEFQTMGSGFKMVSSDSSVLRIFNDKDGQHMQALKGGSAYVYLYTNGGVPFMRLNVSVVYGAVTNGYVDVQPASWRLDASGDTTEIKVLADKNPGDIKLSVEKGNGYIKVEDGKNILVATGNGPIVVKAYSQKSDITGYGIVYVGKYVNALYNGSWTSTGSNITCNYWNPSLWSTDGYKVNGWILTDTGVYLPVIDKVGTYYSKPTDTVVTVYNDLYDMLYNDCKGDFNYFYNQLWYKYNLLNKPAKSFEEMYGSVLAEILEDIEDAYYLQLLPWLKK